jgi:hypothetical protein
VQACVVAVESALAFAYERRDRRPMRSWQRHGAIQPRRPDGTPAFDVEKELDQVVGKFEDRRGSRMQRVGRIAARVLLAAALALAAATIVFYTLDTHVQKAQKAPAPKKPVQVQIVPPPK